MPQVTDEPTLHDIISRARGLVRRGYVDALRELLISSQELLKQGDLDVLANVLACDIKRQPAREKDKTVALLKLMVELEVPIEDSFYATGEPFHTILTAVGAGLVPHRRHILTALVEWNAHKVNAFVGALWKHQRRYIINESVENFITWNDPKFIAVFFPAHRPKMLMRELLAAIKPCIKREIKDMKRIREIYSKNEDASKYCRSEISTLRRKVAVLAENCFGAGSSEAEIVTCHIDDLLVAFLVTQELKGAGV